jgi:phosphinothricin acetyltransferase
LIRSLGFREVGVYEKHGQLDGVWRDVLIVERLIQANIEKYREP